MKIEPVTKEQVEALVNAVGPIAAMISGLYKVDLSRGRGVLKKYKHCLWTDDGRRITVNVDGGIVASTAKEQDPDLPPPLT